ncbi:T9SS type A sorting domain-containing protein [Flammeovirga yaeyamensis]|uniref:T9SS type A sorting domain-containing protein n=1 Tax=Flammeovirga yaeyamensis TaxID=367791 RepID=A0AAX1NBY9_9BACT|nr:Ig-like domain-containing protein [Flammeovirga yaeyamensis]MBB3699065.1 hypothetical protein [Flammeovirga yaeyamensis]NMF36499.1 T9SS type A sorting domain-containing protein [Flammeovirga yaeyamensis]QWG03543.1 T9SS type A sorting domain-containing protein [Flammeovirga yaeyamensis]
MNNIYSQTIVKLFITCFFLISSALINAQTVSSFDIKSGASATTNSAVIPYHLQGTGLDTSAGTFTVERNGSDITSSVDIVVNPDGSGDFYVYVILGDAYLDGATYDINYKEAPANEDAATTVTIDDAASNSTPVSIPTLSPTVDLGYSNSDLITNVDPLLFSVTATTGETVYIKNNLTTIGTAISTGTDLIVTSSLGEGTHTIYAYSIDSDGDISFTSTPVTITIDKTDPSIGSTAIAWAANPTNDTGTSSSDQITSNTSPEVTVNNLPTTDVYNVIVESNIDGQVGSTVISGTTETVNLSGLSNGVHTLVAKVIDDAGNESGASTSLEITIDTIAPDAPTITLKSSSDTGRSDSDKNTNDTTPTFSVFAEVGSSIEIRENSATNGTATSVGTTDVTVGSAYSINGTYTFTARATDLAGNTSLESTTPEVVVIKNVTLSGITAPTLDASTNSGNTGDWITNFSSPILNFTGLNTDDSKYITVTSNLDALNVNHFVDPVNSGNEDVTVSPALATQGVHRLTYFVEDIYGNKTTDAYVDLEFDNVAPNVPSLSLSPSSDTGDSNSDLKTTDTTPTFDITSDFGTTITLYEGSTAKGSITSTGSDQVTSSVIASGSTYNYSATATDVAGNESANSSPTIDVELLVDNSISGIVGVLNSGTDSGVTGDHKTNNQTPSIDFTSISTTNNPDIIVESDIDGQVARVDVTGATQTVALSTLSEGNHVLTFYLEDEYGNQGASATYNLEIDISAPTLTSVTIASDNTDPTVGENNDIVTLDFTSNEDLITTNIVTLDGSAITPTNVGLDYTATKTLSVNGMSTYADVVFNISVLDAAGNSGTLVAATTDASFVKIFPPIVNTINNPSTTEFCTGSNTFSINGDTPTGGDGSTYTFDWQRNFNGGSFASLNYTGEDYTENATLAAGTYIYRRVVSSGGVTVNSSTDVTITINTDISNNVLTGPAQTQYCGSITGGTLTFSGSTPSGGNSTYSYQWEKSTDNGGTWSTIGGSTINYTESSNITLSGTTLYRRVVNSGQCSNTSNQIAIELSPSVTGINITNVSGGTVCINDAVVLIGGAPSGGTGSYSYQWQQQVNNGGYSNIMGATSQSYFISNIASSGNYDFKRITTSGNCIVESNVASVTVPVEPSSYVTLPSTTNYSDLQSTPVNLTMTGLGSATFYCSGPGVVSNGNGNSSNRFIPSIAGQGNHNINYHIVYGSCEKVETVSFTVYDGSSTFNLDPQYCRDDPTVTIQAINPASLTGSPAQSDISYSGTGVVGGTTFDPDVACAALGLNPGQSADVVVTGSYTASLVNYSFDQSVTVTESHTARINIASTSYCLTDADFQIDVILDNVQNATDGSFRVNGGSLRPNPITISPSSLGDGSYYIIYTYSDANGCDVTTDTTITINPLPQVSYDYVNPSDNGDFCFNQTPITIQGKVGGMNVSSGTFSGNPGLVDNGDGTATFNPTLAGGELYDEDEDFIINFEYTDPVTGCTNDSDSMVTVYGFDEVFLATDADDSVCYSAPIVTFTAMEGLAQYAPGGSYSINTGGLTDNGDGTASFDPEAAATAAGEISTGDYSQHIVTFTYNNSLGCTYSINDTIYVKPLPVKPALVSSVPEYCSDDTGLGNIQVSGETGASFVWYSDDALTLVESTTNILTPNDAPTVSSTQVVTYYVTQTSVDGCTSDTLQVHITINPKPLAPVLSTANVTSYCSGETVGQMSVQNPGVNIKWYTSTNTITPVGLGDDFTPVINTNVPRDTTFVYYVTETTNGCEGPGTTLNISVFKSPDAPTFNPVAEICSGGALPTISVATGQNVNWYDDAAKTNPPLNPAYTLGYTPSFNTNVQNDSIVSFYATSTASGCESVTAQVDIIIRALPASPSLSAIPIYCEGETIASITATGEVGASYEWFSDETLTSSVSTSQTYDPMISAPSYPTLDTLNYWVVQVVDGCVSLPTKVDIPVYPNAAKPTVDTNYFVYCSGETISTVNVTTGSNVKWYNEPTLSTVISTSTTFTPIDPNSATDYSQVYYVTQTVNGCESDTTQVTVIINKTPDAPIVNGDFEICSGDTFTQFAVTNSVDNDVTWYSDAGLTSVISNNLAYTPTVGTSVTTETTYTYYVTDTHLGCEGPATPVTITIHPLPELTMVGSLVEDSVYCQSEGLVGVGGSPTGGSFTSPTGAIISQTGSNFSINMADSPLGNHVVKYIYTNANNCLDSTDYAFTIVDVPEVDFGTQVLCDTREVVLTDSTIIRDASQITRWVYNFGDEGSHTITDPALAQTYTHQFATAGEKNITLTIFTDQGCSDVSVTKRIFIGSPPTADFNWSVSEHQSNMIFDDISMPADRDTIASWDWDFGDGNSQTILADLSDLSVNGSTLHQYQNPGTYNVVLTVNTLKGCSKIFTKEAFVVPRISLVDTDDEYFENFDLDNGQWVPMGDLSSWEYGQAAGENLISTSNAWVTDLTSNYHPLEDSYLNSPSFDISGLDRPMVTFDMQLDCETGIDGVAFQYSIDSGQTWQVLGDTNDPINWYNSSNIRSNPGNQPSTIAQPDPVGWTGSTEEEGGIFRETISIRHSLDQFRGVDKEHLRFRFAFKSNSDLEDEGVLIDNFWVGNRRKAVVIETMTNAGEASVNNNTYRLDSVLVNEFSTDVIAINYHVRQDGRSDSLNIDNPEPPSGRTFQYGVSDAPTTIVDGNAFLGYTFDFINNKNYSRPIMSRILLDPEFDISLSLPDVGDPDEIEVTITANKDFSSEDTEIIVHLITVEREINGIEVSEGLYTHKNVMKSMSPAPGAEGTSFLGRSWTNGSSETFTVQWDNPQVYDTSQAEVIALVQNNVNMEIFQAIRVPVSHLVSTDPKDVTSIDYNDLEWSLYPNPASDVVTIKAPQNLSNCEWVLTNAEGRKVTEGVFTGNTYKIDVDDLPSGIYILRHTQGDNAVGNPIKFVVGR